MTHATQDAEFKQLGFRTWDKHRGLWLAMVSKVKSLFVLGRGCHPPAKERIVVQDRHILRIGRAMRLPRCSPVVIFGDDGPHHRIVIFSGTYGHEDDLCASW